MEVCLEPPKPGVARLKHKDFEPLRSVEPDDGPYKDLDLLLSMECELLRSTKLSGDDLAEKAPRRVEIILEEFSRVNTLVAHIIDLILNGLEDGQFNAKSNTMLKQLVDFEARLVDLANHFLRQHGGGVWKRRFLRGQKREDRTRRRAMSAYSMKIADKTKVSEKDEARMAVSKLEDTLAGTKQVRSPITVPIPRTMPPLTMGTSRGWCVHLTRAGVKARSFDEKAEKRRTHKMITRRQIRDCPPSLYLPCEQLGLDAVVEWSKV